MYRPTKQIVVKQGLSGVYNVEEEIRTPQGHVSVRRLASFPSREQAQEYKRKYRP